jgi:hypothetical protein
LPLIAAPVPLDSPPLLNFLEKTNVALLSLPDLVPVKLTPPLSSSNSREIPNDISLLIFSLSNLLIGFATPPSIVVLPFEIFSVPLGVVTNSVSSTPRLPPTVVP